MAINLATLQDTLVAWAKRVESALEDAEVYLFGSLVYRDGEQFTPTSDIDLVVKFGAGLKAVERAEWLEKLYDQKKQLEVELLGILERMMVSPFASVVPVTDREVELDIQKQNQPEFYSENKFLRLSTGELLEGLPRAGSKDPPRLLAGALSVTQGYRNQFLGVAANNRPTLELYDGEDRIPKALMRAAAMARALLDAEYERGAEYDTRLGVDLVIKYLLEHEKSHPRIEALNKLVSERSGSRGLGGPLTQSDQLLLAEIVYDLAPDEPVRASAAGPPSPVVPRPTAAADASTFFDESKAEVATSEIMKPDAADEIPRDALPTLKGESSLSFFSNRFTDAFPGVREIRWFDDRNEAIERLSRLLRTPLRFADGAPIWMWRGGNLDVHKFSRLDAEIVLMNVEELKIRSIAAVPGPTYKWNFVYVETDAMNPTGLYKLDDGQIAELVSRRGYVSEEYGLFDGSHRFDRAEYDDGGTYIDGEYVETTGRSELRVRYITPYNFLIASQHSPINNIEFDALLVEYLNRALHGDSKEVLPSLAEEIFRLPLRRGE